MASIRSDDIAFGRAFFRRTKRTSRACPSGSSPCRKRVHCSPSAAAPPQCLEPASLDAVVAVATPWQPLSGLPLLFGGFAAGVRRGVREDLRESTHANCLPRLAPLSPRFDAGGRGHSSIVTQASCATSSRRSAVDSPARSPLENRSSACSETSRLASSPLKKGPGTLPTTSIPSVFGEASRASPLFQQSASVE